MVICVGENINVMTRSISSAFKERNAQVIQDMAKAEAEGGVHYLDLNIGPARKGGDELMTWLVQTIQDVVDLPISLDTTNPIAMEAGLKVHKGRALVNSVSLQPERMESLFPLIKKYDADVVGLLWGKEGMPRDANERAALAVDLVYMANEAGIATENIWIDPIVTPVSAEINQVISCLEFMSMLKDIAPEAKSIVGISNISNGTPKELRPYLNRTYLIMLMKYGLHAAILDAFDREIISIARGEQPDMVNLVHKVMDGEEVDLKSLSPKEVEYVKTTRVLMGKSVYSHSWLTL
ncbi:MAG TPA: dihydropteroate synthase [Syntrophaceae bacterium]|nr:dihydropteroate synthase [Syntrophaceae bacterium]